MASVPHDSTWILVVACTDTFGVRVLFGRAGEAEGFVRWLRASGWTVRTEPTRARSPHALARTRGEEDLALGLTVAYSRWMRDAGCRSPVAGSLA